MQTNETITGIYMRQLIRFWALVTLILPLTPALLFAEELFVISESAKLYSAPDDSSKVIIELPKDTAVVFYKQRVRWMHVIAGDYSGWIMSGDLSFQSGGVPVGTSNHEKVKPRRTGSSGGGDDGEMILDFVREEGEMQGAEPGQPVEDMTPLAPENTNRPERNDGNEIQPPVSTEREDSPRQNSGGTLGRPRRSMGSGVPRAFAEED